MTILGISASNGALYCQDRPDRPASRALEVALSALPPDAPVVVMVHGYRFDPSAPGSDPHRLIYAPEPEWFGRRTASWPRGLGFGEDAQSGLCVGFGWPARAAGARAWPGRSHFAAVYRRAAQNGAALAELLSLIGRLAPQRQVDIFAHSLGVRVALGALRGAHEAVFGRMILMGGAEFCVSAAQAMDRCAARRRPEVFNFISRQNALFDLLFTALAPNPAGCRRPLGKGLAPAPPGWIDIDMENPALVEFAARRGIRLAGRRGPVSHWGFYTRSGAMAVHRALLRDRAAWPIATLRRVLEGPASASFPRPALFRRGRAPRKLRGV